ncbi:MAG TPA: hypothetical protein VFN35_12585, partial [Ktedonobacteraceae bacterium]|nr:hypothetical protein [Ktedonobacteraceae bacterium]
MILPVHHEAPISTPAQTELRAHPQWVCWRVEERNGKPTKVPYNPRIGQLARSNDPTTWGSYQHACEAWQREPERYQGIGFMFQQDYTGIDLDHCVRVDGSIDPWARVLVEQLATYTEYSPNDGLHLFLRGTIPAGIRRRIAWAGRSDAAFEMYCQGRYFTVTGRQVPGTSGVIATRDEKLQEIVADLTLLDKAHNAKNGETFRALWRGETAGYASASEADLALCNLLAFWTNCDPERMDRLFRQSGLYRLEKWDRSARAGETYGQGTIARARISPLSKERSATDRLVEPPTKGIVLSFPTRTALAEDADLQTLGDLPQPDLAFIMDCLFREEEGDARLYAFLFQGRCIYDHTEGMWYEWQGHVWKRDEQKHSLKLVSNLLASVYLHASALLSQQAADQSRQIDPDLKD